MNLYRSPYEAYPFLCDAGEDLRCDFELLTDEMASQTGLLAAKTAEAAAVETAGETARRQEAAETAEEAAETAEEAAKAAEKTPGPQVSSGWQAALSRQMEYARLQRELLWICELIYHINPTLRTHLTVTEDETRRLEAAVERLRKECGERCRRFVLTQGCESACIAHLLRVKSKMLVRLIYRHCQKGHTVPDRLLDLANLLSGYFFYLALKLNALEGVEEIDYISRNY